MLWKPYRRYELFKKTITLLNCADGLLSAEPSIARSGGHAVTNYPPGQK